MLRSRVQGRVLKRFSDLDLVVQNEEDQHAELQKLWDASEASDLPIKVDLSEWTSASGVLEEGHIGRIRGAPGTC